jgi:hypothetical protein
LRGGWMMGSRSGLGGGPRRTRGVASFEFMRSIFGPGRRDRRSLRQAPLRCWALIGVWVARFQARIFRRRRDTTSPAHTHLFCLHLLHHHRTDERFGHTRITSEGFIGTGLELLDGTFGLSCWLQVDGSGRSAGLGWAWTLRGFVSGRAITHVMTLLDLLVQ